MHVSVAAESLPDRGENFFDGLFAAIDRLVKRVLAVLPAGQGPGGGAISWSRVSRRARLASARGRGAEIMPARVFA